MDTLNPEDNEAIQIQSVDNIVNEIREIADHLYQDVRNPEFNPQASIQSQKSPYASQTHFFQPREASSEFMPQASMQSQKSPHASQTQFFQPREAASLEPQRETPRRDDSTNALKRSGVSGVNPSEISKGLSKLHARVDEVLRNASVGRNSHRLAESTVQAIRNRQSFTQQEGLPPSSTTNYGSVPRAPMFQQNATSQYSSNVPSATNPTYHNPFAATPDVVSHRPEEIESDRRPPMISQSNYLGTNPDLIRAIKEGRNLRNSGIESNAANPLAYSNVPRSENDLNRNYQSSIHPAMNERPSSLQDVMGSAGVTGNFPTASTSAGLSMSVSTPLLNTKPRYDRSKLDSIISGIRTRESGGPSSSALRTSVLDTQSLSQSQVNLPPTPVSRQPHQKSSAPSFAPENFTTNNIPVNIPKSPNYNRYDSSQVPSKTDISSPVPTPQNRGSHSLYRPNPLSPQQFQGPQSFLSPTATNPFNTAAQQQQPRSVNTLDEEEHTDYYGIFQQPQRRGSETKKRPVQPQRSQDYYEEAPMDYPREEFEYHPYQLKGYQPASRNPEPTRYVMRRSATSKQELHSRGSARQERLAGRQPRIELAEEPRKKRLAREPQEGFFCGEVENDDDSVMKDYSAEKSQPMRARRRSYNQNQSASKQQIPEENFACGGLEDDSIESLSSIHRDSPPQQRAQQQFQPAPRPLRRPSHQRPLGEERSQEYMPEYVQRNEEFVLGPRQRRPSIPKQEQPRTSEPQQQTKSSRRNSRSKNRPALGGGEMVFLGGTRANEENIFQKRPAQSFGKEQRQGGSVPRRGASRERGNVGPATELVRRDENISNRMPPRGYSGEEIRANELLGSSGKKGGSQRKFMNNDEDISDFDFEVNRVENKVIIVEESPEVARKRRLRQSRADEDSVVRAFEHAKYDNSGRKSTQSNVARGTVKTEMVLNANFGPKRKLYR